VNALRKASLIRVVTLLASFGTALTAAELIWPK
jgi:hypothetical protein